MNLLVAGHISYFMHHYFGQMLKFAPPTEVFGGTINKATFHIIKCIEDTLNLFSLQSVHLHGKKKMRAESADPFYSSHFHTYKSVIPTEGFVSCQWSSLTLAEQRMAQAQVHHYSMFTVTAIEQGHINDALLSSAVFHSGC